MHLQATSVGKTVSQENRFWRPQALKILVRSASFQEKRVDDCIMVRETGEED
jgi:hypothetical protein